MIMMTYKEYQETIFNWLNGKRKTDPSFTFSLRMKANKGSETNYFIGTEKSKYFGTTFWNIPIGYPGSSTDLINLFFVLAEGGYSYYIQFYQTRNPDSEQNRYALEFIRQIKPEVKAKFDNFHDNDPKSKMEYYFIKSGIVYSSIEALIINVEQDILKLLLIVNKELGKFKDVYPDFKAHQFTLDEFDQLYMKLQNRRAKYKADEDRIGEVSEKNIPLKKPEKSIPKVPESNNKQPLNQILFGPPGTGKTYNTVNKAIEIANPGFDLNKQRHEVKKEFDRLINDGQVVFSTFHQSLSYEDFIEGIKPLKPEINDDFVKYEVVQGIFKMLCRKSEIPENLSFDKAYTKLLADLEKNSEFELNTSKESFRIQLSDDGENLSVKSNSQIKNISKDGLEYVSKSQKYAGKWGTYYKSIFQFLKERYGYLESEISKVKNHVLIIDEINRGNVSQIFGELITLIEEDKRLGQDEALEVILPYSKERFGVPSNLYIIGTMNTADRSVEAIDTALRRRFSFEEIPPKYDLEGLEYELAGYKASKILQTINKRIEKLIDKDHAIGHSYFMLKDHENPEGRLITSFYTNIIPLLQEYFFGDFGKIGLVLGQGFVQKNEWNKNSDSFAEFDYESASEYDDRTVYEIIDYRKENETDRITGFKMAIRKLMNEKVE